MRFVRSLVLLASLISLAVDATAELRVSVAETSPPSPTVVATDEPVFLRLEYAGAERTRLWVAPYFQGQPVARVKTNTSRAYEGSGVALAWFSLDGESRVDELRIRAGGGRPYKEIDAARYPMDVRGTGQPGSDAPPRAQWVTDLILANRAAAEKVRADARKGGGASDALLFSGFGLAVMGFIALSVLGPLWALWKWRGAWRWLGALPLPVMAFVVGRIVIDTSRDPTSHNLWPFEVLMFGAGGVALFGVLLALRRLRGRE